MKSARVWVPALLLLALLAASFWWWQLRPKATEPAPIAHLPAPLSQTASGEVSAAAPAEPASAAEAPASAPPLSPEPPLAASEWPAALGSLVGRDMVLRHLQSDDFSRRLVATVDNLGRSMAPSRVWPVNPSAGRFLVDKQGSSTVIAAANAKRYDNMVRLLTATPTPALVALYGRAYPQLQQAYVDLGYPKGSFHQRLLQVLDLLLATPVLAAPPELVLTEVKGSVPSTRPWVRYELADPALERLASGQKILLRVGPEHGQALRAKLASLRSALAAAPR